MSTVSIAFYQLRLAYPNRPILSTRWYSDLGLLNVECEYVMNFFFAVVDVELKGYLMNSRKRRTELV